MLFLDGFDGGWKKLFYLRITITNGMSHWSFQLPLLLLWFSVSEYEVGLDCDWMIWILLFRQPLFELD